MSAPASLPELPKWIRMNLPWMWLKKWFKIGRQYLRNLKISYETGRVVVTGGLGVTKGLKYRVGLHDLIFEVTLQ